MGFLGTLIGWDQTKSAHNAVLASYLADTASPQLKRAIGERLVIIIQHTQGIASPEAILAMLSDLPRMSQTNFIALACNNLGIPAPFGLAFAEVRNPYSSDSHSSRDRLGVALIDLSRRARHQLSWPGNEVRIDFTLWVSPWSDLRPAEIPAPPASVDIPRAVILAYEAMLLEQVDRTTVAQVAVAFAEEGVGGSCAYELALSVTLYLLEEGDLGRLAMQLQLHARMKACDWAVAGLIRRSAAAEFEERLYVRFRP